MVPLVQLQLPNIPEANMEQKELDVKIEKAHRRIDLLDRSTIVQETNIAFQERRIKNLEDSMTQHMQDEALQWEKLNLKIDNILRYKWVVVGVLGTLWVLSDSAKFTAIVAKLLG